MTTPTTTTHPAARPAYRPSLATAVLGRFERFLLWALAVATIAPALLAAWMQHAPILFIGLPPAIGIALAAFYLLGLHNGERHTLEHPPGEPALIARARFAWVAEVRDDLHAIADSGEPSLADLATIAKIRQALDDYELKIATSQARETEISMTAAITAAGTTAPTE